MPISLERLYDDHSQSIFAFLLNFTRNEQDTRDVMQELFCKIAARPSLLDGARDERALLIRLAHNMAIDHLRRRSTRDKNHVDFGRENDSLFAAEQGADDASLQRSLAGALAELPPEQRAVVHLKLYDDATFEQIARALDISANTAASRYRYAIDKLRARLRLLYEEIKNP